MAIHDNENAQESPTGRRGVLGAAAWAAPIIAVSIAAPASVASENESPA
ncbi:hypothetical protein [Pseudoclavibacter helvolus]